MDTALQSRRRRQAIGIVSSFLMFSFASSGSFSDFGAQEHAVGSVERIRPTLAHPAWMSMFAMLGLPALQEIVFGKRRRRRFWAALRGTGVWENEFLKNLPYMSLHWHVPDVENKAYEDHVRMGYVEFWHLHEEYGKFLKKKDTRWRRAVPSHKRLALTLNWLAHGGSLGELGRKYAIGKSTAVKIVHDTIAVLGKEMVRKAIRFPEGNELKRVMKEFETLSHMERCAGAVDGTFMKLKKPPILFGDSYWCYKKYCAIIILGTVDACGLFTNVNAGRAGSAGDASVYATSTLTRKIHEKKWLTVKERRNARFRVGGTYIRPYLVGDSAFPLSATLMKCYDDGGCLTPAQRTFNYRVIRTRRVVEQAFGRLKGRWQILVNNHLDDPDFARDIALVCCGLHNICERWNCPAEPTWLANSAAYSRYHPGPNDQPNADFETIGVTVRNKLALRLHQLHPV